MTDSEYAAQSAFFRAFPKATLEAQYAKNAKSLRAMLAKAEATGRKVGGFTADVLRERAETFERLSCAS